MTIRPPQAKDIADAEALEAVQRCYRANLAKASLWDVQRDLGSYPPKVVRAKLRALVKRGWLRGCACGCRGDFEVIVCIDCHRVTRLHPVVRNGRCAECA